MICLLDCMFFLAPSFLSEVEEEEWKSILRTGAKPKELCSAMANKVSSAKDRTFTKLSPILSLKAWRVGSV